MSDVLIKGIEMPKACGDCPFFKRGANPMGEDFIFAQPWGDCLVSGEENVIEHDISMNCPLVEVKPHGRLIDADAEIEAWEHTKTVLKECEQKKTFAFKEACMAVKVLSDAPTVLESSNGTISD